MAPNIVSLQGGHISHLDGEATIAPVQTLDEMAIEVLECCNTLNLHKVNTDADSVCEL